MRTITVKDLPCPPCVAYLNEIGARLPNEATDRIKENNPMTLPYPTPNACPRCGEPKFPAAPVCHQCLQDDLADEQKINADLLAALEEIAKGEGPYSLDQLTHAENVIANMVNIANAAIAKVKKG
jgi:hypothetical protein